MLRNKLYLDFSPGSVAKLRTPETVEVPDERGNLMFSILED